MGNQMESAMKRAAEDAGRNLGEMAKDAIDELTEQLDALELDGVTKETDNNTAVAEDAERQEEPTMTVDELHRIVEDQKKDIDRLIEVMGRMVKQYGAQLTDRPGENVNTSLGDDQGDDIPLLSELKLG